MSQDTIAILIVTLTVIYTVYKLYRTITDKKTEGCGGCSNCPSKPDVLKNAKIKPLPLDVTKLKEMKMSPKSNHRCCS